MFRNRSDAKAELLVFIIAIAIVFVFLAAFEFSENNISFGQTDQFSKSESASRNQAILQFQSQFCGMNSTLNKNSFITEYLLPQKCEMH